MKSNFFKKLTIVALTAVIAVSGIMTSSIDTYAKTSKTGYAYGANTPTDFSNGKAPKAGTVIKTANGYKYTFYEDANGKLSVSFSAAKTTNKKVDIPATILAKDYKKYSITRIERNAFNGNSKVEQIIVPKTVKEIGANAFSNCKKLKTVTIKTTNLTSKKLSNSSFVGVRTSTTIKVPKSKLNSYKKLFQQKGLDKKVKISK